jgi:sulfotransferase family protein
MASMAEIFSPTLLTAKANMGARSNLPVFVVGMPRSGTTLVEQILASHPMVHGSGELKRLHTLVDEIEGFPNAAGDLTAAQFRRSARPISLSSSQWRRDDAMW